MQTIEIDFEVFKKLTIRRSTEEETHNDVLRQLLGLSSKKDDDKASLIAQGRPWLVRGGESFPHGTDFRCLHKGQAHFGKVDNGFLRFNGKKFSSPSAAAMDITKNSVNGWNFWECRLPGRTKWISINKLRGKIN